MAQWVGRGIALLFYDSSTKGGWVVSSTPRPHFTPGKKPVHILQEAGWAPGPVWKGWKSRPHWDSIPDHPACSQSLYKLSYPAHKSPIISAFKVVMWKNVVEPSRPQMSIWHMHTACWIPKSKNTHSGYVILIDFPLQQWLHERACMLRYT